MNGEGEEATKEIIRQYVESDNKWVIQRRRRYHTGFDYIGCGPYSHIFCASFCMRWEAAREDIEIDEMEKERRELHFT